MNGIAPLEQPPLYIETQTRAGVNQLHQRGQPENLRSANPATTHPCRKEGSRAPHQNPRWCFLRPLALARQPEDPCSSPRLPTTTIVTGFSGFLFTIPCHACGPQARTARESSDSPPFESRPRRRIPPLSKRLSGA